MNPIQVYKPNPSVNGTSVYGKHVHGKHSSGVSHSTGYFTEKVIEDIFEIYLSVKDLSNEEILQDSSNHLRNLYQKLDHLIALNIYDKSAEDILCNSAFNLAFDDITRFRSLYTAKLEIEHAHSILESKHPMEILKNFNYISNYLKLSRTEYQGAKLKPGDSVVFLGSGPLPLTLIVLCRWYGLKGIGIEQDPYRADVSRKVLEKLGFSDQIEIINGNHLTLPLETRSDLIMIAAQAEPKKEIFDHLAKVLPKGTKLSYRIYEKGLRRLLDTFSLFELSEPFEEFLRVRPEPPVNNTVVFATKKY
ncbi:MAG TPA: methyltransferase [Methanosarcinaceae archaeon]|nr:methyltransferase [Methanosarcinaceae archaeon]